MATWEHSVVNALCWRIDYDDVDSGGMPETKVLDGFEFAFQERHALLSVWGQEIFFLYFHLYVTSGV